MSKGPGAIQRRITELYADPGFAGLPHRTAEIVALVFGSEKPTRSQTVSVVRAGKKALARHPLCIIIVRGVWVPIERGLELQDMAAMLGMTLDVYLAEGRARRAEGQLNKAVEDLNHRVWLRNDTAQLHRELRRSAAIAGEFT